MPSKLNTYNTNRINNNSKNNTQNNANKASDIFHTWSHEDFYGPKARHVYFYGKITQEAAQDFRKDLFNASKSSKTAQGVNLKPRPICVHIHSQGGDAGLGVTIANFLREVRLPIAVVVDGYACSAITPLLVAAPYRVMHDGAFVMIHEPSVRFSERIKKGDFDHHANLLDKLVVEYVRFYEGHTSLPVAKIKEMMERDIFMNAETCLKYSVVDRVIPMSKQRAFTRWNSYVKAFPELKLSKNPMSWKVSLNHLYNYNISNASSDSVFPTDNVLLNEVIRPMHDVMMDHNADTPMPVVLHSYMTPSMLLFDVATLMIHVNIMSVPVIGVIDNNINIIQALPCIMAWRRYMYDNTYIQLSLVFDHNSWAALYYDDIKYNTELIRNTIRKILKQHSKMPEAMLGELFEKRQFISAQECKDLGLIDDIIPSISRSKNKVMRGGCTCSQGLSLDYSLA